MKKQTLAKAALEMGDEDRIGSSPPRQLCTVSKTALEHIAPDQTLLSLQQISTVHDNAMLLHATMRTNVSTIRSTSTSGQVLATNWRIDVKTAARTVKATTQRGIVRTVLHPTLSCRFRTNDRQLRSYRQLAIDCFTDTLFSNTTSRRNKKCAQIFATPEG